jgi:hypothetical protein
MFAGQGQRVQQDEEWAIYKLNQNNPNHNHNHYHYF